MLQLLIEGFGPQVPIVKAKVFRCESPLSCLLQSSKLMLCACKELILKPTGH